MKHGLPVDEFCKIETESCGLGDSLGKGVNNESACGNILTVELRYLLPGSTASGRCRDVWIARIPCFAVKM
jgi:hypothetical protein